MRLYLSIVILAAVYASKTWKMCARVIKKVDGLHRSCLRRIMRIRYVDRVFNQEVLRRCDTTRMHVAITQRRLRFASHILRMPQHRIPRSAMSWTPSVSKRPTGRPGNTLRQAFTNDLKLMDISKEKSEALAHDRQQWREFVA
ncbi:hypothetical protein Y032_0585g315 [Ancylostoma ceylanicum]|uniref:Uncharacterized protein n=1 Tax=Ancylostoma ceylanicum TaxID=53326 RepID=A0A016WPR5_9BILA|nr:hypothetical protein Y032_0585g315 [Ancylostoma ceylanicum]